MKRILAQVALLVTLVLTTTGFIVVGTAAAQETGQAGENQTVVWTTIIPEGFPQNVYTWHLRPDGTYDEEGRDIMTGRFIRSTLSGRWALKDTKMTLTQDGTPFVFEGTVIDNYYAGILYLDGKPVSTFCAHKGESIPENCDAELNG